MRNKRTVFLFGAGATLAWGSPTTAHLTESIRQWGFKTADNQTTITEFIYQTLRNNGYAEWDINFETIISVIEELMVFYSPFNSRSKTPSLLSAFFTAQYEKELLHYSIEGGTARHGYQLQIPPGTNYPFSNRAYHDETPNQFFFQHLLSALLMSINATVQEYAYHTPTSPLDSVESDASVSFVNWIGRFAEGRVLRFYTLNYERIFKILMTRAGLSVFEGFDCGADIDHDLLLRANVPRILTDIDSHTQYNLHGSAFWQVQGLDKDQLPNPEIVMGGVLALAADNPVCIQVEKGKTLLVTNIITGYQKAQRGMVTPFRQMQAAFDRDSCSADEIYVIGYSFGDEHINESIKTAIRHNEKLRITIVDPYFIKNGMDHQLGLRFFPFRQDVNMRASRVSDNLYSYFGGAFTVHTIGFEEFLEAHK